MSNESGNVGMWRAVSYGLAAFSQALIMFLLYLIFQQQANIFDRMENVEKGQARLEGIVSTINFNTPQRVPPPERGQPPQMDP